MPKIFWWIIFGSLSLLPNLVVAQGQCQAGWVDTHVHYNSSAFMQDALVQQNRHDVNCALLLNMELNPAKPNKSYQNVETFLQHHPKQFFPFFTTNGMEANDNRVSLLTAAVGSHVATFAGMGESAFYSSEFAETELTSNLWKKIFNYAGKNDLILMIHLRPGQADDLDTMLTDYPGTTVLLHGAEIYESLDSLLTEHDNLMYTLDTSILLWGSAGNLMYPNDGGSAASFIAAYDANAATLLAEAQAKWYALIAAHPNKVMWGTDISEDWHINKRVYNRLLQFSEDFAAPLNDVLEKKYQRTNAINFLGKNGITL